MKKWREGGSGEKRWVGTENKRERGRKIGSERGGEKRRGEKGGELKSTRIYYSETIGYFKSSRIGRSPYENS